jgi:histidine triad (HIT) family protein
MAKTHLLIIPKKEIPTIDDINESDKETLSDMLFVAKKLALDFDIV